MYKNILVPIAMDHSCDTGTALDVARALAAEGAKITALSIIDDIPAQVTTYLPADYGEKLLEETEISLKAELGGVKDVKPVVTSGNPGREIVDFAETHDIDCIVIASHRPGLQDYFLGSTASRVVRHAPCAVHVVR